MKSVFERVAPARRDRLEVRIVMRDAMFVLRFEPVAFDHLQIQRQTDRKVRLQRGIETDHQQFHRIFHAHLRIIAADDDRSAVFGLADLEERGVPARLDEVAFGVDHEQPRLHAGNLPCDDDRRREAPPALHPVRILAFRDDRSQQLADFGRDLEHGRRFEDDVVPLVRFLHPFFELADDRLRAGQIAGRQQRDDPLARDVPGEHLAKDRDIVDAGIGARIAHQDESLVEHHAHAIRHLDFPLGRFTAALAAALPPHRLRARLTWCRN